MKIAHIFGYCLFGLALAACSGSSEDDARGGGSGGSAGSGGAVGTGGSAGATPRQPGEPIVTHTVENLGATPLAGAPITFGQVFRKGEVPAGAALTATLDGAPVEVQQDVKATHADGSLKHVILTFEVPSLAANAEAKLVLATGDPLAGEALTPAALLATAWDTVATFELGGKKYEAHARALLEASSAACKPWDTTCDEWLSGPLASEWVVRGQAEASDGAVAPNLTVSFAIRAYAGDAPGTVGAVETDVIVENVDAYAPQGQPVYTATLTSGTASYTSPALTQYMGTRWHRVLSWNDAAPNVYLRQDTGYLQESRAISRYQALTPDDALLEKVRQSCDPLEHCDQTQTMGNTGAQPAIGPLPRWTSVYVVHPDVRAYRWMLANADALGAYSVHYRDAATGWPLSIERHPYVTVVNWRYAQDAAKGTSETSQKWAKDLLPNCTDNAVVSGCDGSIWYNTGNPNEWDAAHQPTWSYVPYLVTGSYYYMSELAFGASYNLLYPNPPYRDYQRGLVGGAYGQVRGQAWVLRNLANAAWLLPDTHPLKAEHGASVANSLEDYNQRFSHAAGASPLGLLMTNGELAYSADGIDHAGIATWQHAFLSWSAGHAAELDFAGAADFRDWLTRFETGTLTDWKSDPKSGFCWLLAASYTLIVVAPDEAHLTTFKEVYARNFPTLVGLECNEPAMLTELGKLQDTEWHAGKMTGYPYAATGFPANLQIGAATAADSSNPKGADAWRTFDSRADRPDGNFSGDSDTYYRNYPNFAVVPRSL
ncbi:MAG: hypothetical protein OZ928_21215 [Polyangiaceae bacterium]|nr:hypothetical protein [Polyangiaceae bacterium]